MKIAELREKKLDELKTELLGLREEQFKLRIQKGTGEIENPARLNTVRKDIARVKTVMNEMKRAQA